MKILKYFEIMALCVILLLMYAIAYNLGHYDSLQYQKMHDECFRSCGGGLLVANVSPSEYGYLTLNTTN